MTTTTPDTRKQTSDDASSSRVYKLGAVGGDWLDQRLSGGGFVKFIARKIFPDHWSFMFGEVALY
ncbi:MAG: ubiquinol-cytochrome c reductase cytochrome b subunit, partial [Brachybacterium tyrofermentans]